MILLERECPIGHEMGVGLEDNHSRKKQCGEMCVLDIIAHCKVCTGVCVRAVTVSLR